MGLSLDAAGVFAGPPIEREISWQQGDESYKATVFVRKLSYLQALGDIRSINDQSDAVAERIAAAICDQDGKPVFTAKDVTGEADPARGPLDYGLTVALLNAISEVNGLGKSQS